MVTLTVNTRDENFLSYLNLQNKRNEDGSYVFSTSRVAAEVFSRYILRKLIEEMVKNVSTKQIVKELLAYISNEKMAEILKEIEELVVEYIEKEEKFHLEGFLVFRLKKQSIRVKEELEKAYLCYCDDGTSNSEYLKRIMQQQIPVEEELKLILDKNNKLKLVGKKRIYLEEEITNFGYKSEDNVISHIVLMSPKQLKVYDPNDKLSKETVIILKRLFEEKVHFIHEIDVNR